MRNRNETLAEWLHRIEEQYARLAVRPHYVYRAYDAAGRLLYVGCTVDVEKRLTAHRSTSQWADYMASHTVESFPDKETGRAAESAAIESEGAYFNATRGDIAATQANRNAAHRILRRNGQHRPRFDWDALGERRMPTAEEWAPYEEASDAYDGMVNRLRWELKDTTHPYLTDGDRLERYLRDRRAAA